MADLNQDIDDIINKDILEILGAKNLTDDEKLKLYEKISDTIENRVFVRIDDKLTDSDVEEWKQVLNTGDNKKIQEFLQSKGIDFMKMLLEEALIYKTEVATLKKLSK